MALFLHGWQAGLNFLVNSLSFLAHLLYPALMQKLNSYTAQPDKDGHFGVYGGRYVAETLMPLITPAVEAAYEKAKADPAFSVPELDYYLKHYVGRRFAPLSRRASDRASGRCKNLPEEREELRPHRRA